MHKTIRAALVLIAVIASVVVYARLPETVPLHWGVDGRADDFGPKWQGAGIMPAVMLLLWGVMTFLPRIDPLRANYVRFQRTYDQIVTLILASLLAMHFIILGAISGSALSVEVWMRVVVGLMLIGLGLLLPRTEPNWFVGIRTPWTLASPTVWKKTHKVAGALMVAVGAIVALSAMLSGLAGVWVLVCAAVALVVVSVVYSYVLWREEQREQREQCG